MKSKVIVAAAAALILAATLVPASAALAADAGHTPVIVPGAPTDRPTGLSSVYSFDTGSNGTSYQADATRTGPITKTTAAGAVSTLVGDPGGFVTGVSERSGIVYYIVRHPGSTPFEFYSGEVMAVPAAGGEPTLVADLGAAFFSGINFAYDFGSYYGFVGLPQSCIDQFIGVRGTVPATQQGGDDHFLTQSVATASGIYILDSGFNSVLKVSYSGVVSGVAAIPAAHTFVANQAFLDTNMMPACALGYRYRPQAGPTAITAGPDGSLFVASSPYGAGGLGGQPGFIDKVTVSGTVTRIIGSLKVPTGISATPSGTIYVSERSGGTTGTGGISVVRVNAQVARPVTNVKLPGALQFQSDKLYVVSDGTKLKVIPLTYK